MRTLALLVALTLAACGSDPEPKADSGSSKDAGARLDATEQQIPDDASAGRDASLHLDASTSPGLDGSLTPGVDASAIPGLDASILPGLDAAFVAPDAAMPLHACAEVTTAAPDLTNYDAVVGCLRNPGENASSKDQAVHTFVAAVESHGGFPIVQGARVIFVYVRDPALDTEGYAANLRNEPLRVAGDFNAWQPATTLASEGSSFFHVDTTLASDPNGQRLRYKFVAKDGGGADVWYSDPFSRRFDYDGNGRISLIRGGAAQGHLEWIRSVHATKLANDRAIYLYVPRGYDSATTSYPVVYMHDGNNLFDPAQPRSAPISWEADAVAETEITAGRAKEFVIVGVPNNNDRMDEYTQTTDTVSGQVMGGKGDQYADFLVYDLKPLVDARYRTLSGRESTAIHGSSLGGLISYYVGLHHPEVFKYVGGMSSTFDWGQGMNPTILDDYAAATDLATRNQVFYLDSGGNEPSGGCKFDGKDNDGDNYCATLKMRDTLVALGIDTFPDDPTAAHLTPDGIDILHYWQPGAVHSESEWTRRVYMTYRLFFRP